jgi:hypothetical protein
MCEVVPDDVRVGLVELSKVREVIGDLANGQSFGLLGHVEGSVDRQMSVVVYRHGDFRAQQCLGSKQGPAHRGPDFTEVEGERHGHVRSLPLNDRNVAHHR